MRESFGKTCTVIIVPRNTVAIQTKLPAYFNSLCRLHLQHFHQKCPAVGGFYDLGKSGEELAENTAGVGKGDGGTGSTVKMDDGVSVFPRVLHRISNVVGNAPNGSGTVNRVIDIFGNGPAARVIYLEIETQNAFKFGEQPRNVRCFQAAFCTA